MHPVQRYRVAGERHPGWRDPTGIGRVVLVRDDDDEKTKPRTGYFISSLALDAAFLAHAVRSHRVIENDLHRVLDVGFREDDGRVRRDNGPANPCPSSEAFERINWQVSGGPDTPNRTLTRRMKGDPEMRLIGLPSQFNGTVRLASHLSAKAPTRR